ncbi:MAG TPA: hypothetical protein VK436_04215 [Methanocella sp.]|nr:hypothetical protein [Methanocella sp.]
MTERKRLIRKWKGVAPDNTVLAIRVPKELDDEDALRQHIRNEYLIDIEIGTSELTGEKIDSSYFSHTCLFYKGDMRNWIGCMLDWDRDGKLTVWIHLKHYSTGDNWRKFLSNIIQIDEYED